MIKTELIAVDESNTLSHDPSNLYNYPLTVICGNVFEVAVHPEHVCWCLNHYNSFFVSAIK